MKENKFVKIGIVGLGRGYSLIKDSLKESYVKLTAICDKNAQKLEDARKNLAEDFGITDIACFSDYDEFLTADIDAVVIATDAVLHVPFVIKAMDCGKHVLSEIPAVNSLEEAKMLKKTVGFCSRPSYCREKYFISSENDARYRPSQHQQSADHGTGDERC